MEKDSSGRDRIAVNVLASWAGHFVFVIAGFVLPRIIDESIGQFSLGIWDFSWSIVNYLAFFSLGIGSSLNRYVAMYNTSKDYLSLNKSASSVVLLQLIVGSLTGIMTIVITVLIPRYFTHRLGDNTEMAQWVVFWLGLSLSFQMAFETFRGIITGCHRWDLHNGLNAGSHALSVGTMIVALIYGGGLKSISFIYFFWSAIAEIIRIVIAYKVCPQLKLKISYIEFKQSKVLFIFGLKSVIAGLPALIVTQGTNIILTNFLGASALAIFSRPNGLIRSFQTLINKFSFILTPTAGSIQSSGKIQEIQKFVKTSAKTGVFLTIPAVIFLSFLGDSVIYIWMGRDYVRSGIMTILAIGAFLPITQMSVLSILIGLDLHGRASIYNLVITLFSFAAGIAIQYMYGWNLTSMAILLGSCLTIGNGIFIPVYACRKLKINIYTFLKEIFSKPIVICLPHAILLFAIRLLFKHKPIVALIVGLLVSALYLIPMYWQFVISPDLKGKILSKIGLKKKVYTG